MYRKIRVLIAEDDPNDVVLLKRAFQKAGVNTPLGFVSDGQEAVDYLAGSNTYSDRTRHPLPHLILLDIKMPRFGGFDVLKWLRTQPGLRRLPVIMFSSSSEQRDVDLAHELGANGYAVKPTSPDGMHAVVLGLEAFWLRVHLYPDCDTPRRTSV